MGALRRRLSVRRRLVGCSNQRRSASTIEAIRCWPSFATDCGPEPPGGVASTVIESHRQRAEMAPVGNTEASPSGDSRLRGRNRAPSRP